MPGPEPTGRRPADPTSGCTAAWHSCPPARRPLRRPARAGARRGAGVHGRARGAGAGPVRLRRHPGSGGGVPGPRRRPARGRLRSLRSGAEPQPTRTVRAGSRAPGHGPRHAPDRPEYADRLRQVRATIRARQSRRTREHPRAHHAPTHVPTHVPAHVGPPSSPRPGRCWRTTTSSARPRRRRLRGARRRPARARGALGGGRERAPARLHHQQRLAAAGHGGAHLRDLGVPATDEDVVNSAQAAADHLAREFPAGSAVLLVGTTGLREALTDVGLRPTDDRREAVAVVQGFSPDLGWQQLAEATHAVRSGLPWVATNLDATVPTPGGPLPATGCSSTSSRGPRVGLGRRVRQAGARALRRRGGRLGARRALVVGDRLDTDLQGARTAGLDGLLVLTGVTGVRSC